MTQKKISRAARFVPAIVVACAFSAPAASARSLEDTVKLAVIKQDVAPNFEEDRDAGKEASAYWDYYTGKRYAFGTFRLMSTTSDLVCGSFKRPDGTEVGFYYDGYRTTLDTANRKLVDGSCRDPVVREQRHGKTWLLNCFDHDLGKFRGCDVFADLPGDGPQMAVMVSVLKLNSRKVMRVLGVVGDGVTGKSATVTIAGRTQDCIVEEVPEMPGSFSLCDLAKAQQLAQDLTESDAVTIRIGDRSTAYTTEELVHFLGEADRYLLTFAGGEVGVYAAKP